MAVHNATSNVAPPMFQVQQEQWLNACKTGVGAWLDFCSTAAGGMEQLRKLQIEAVQSFRSQTREIADDILEARDFASLVTAQSRLVPQYMTQSLRHWTGYLGLLQRARLDLMGILKSRADRLRVLENNAAAGVPPVSMEGVFQVAQTSQEAFLKSFADWADAAARHAPLYAGDDSAAPAAARKPQSAAVRRAH